MQLRPVMAKWIFDMPSSPVNQLVFSARSLWHQFKCIELRFNHRQGDDKEYADILNRIRFGFQTEDDLLKLNSRVLDTYPLDAIHIFGKNAPANEHNSAMLDELEGELETNKAVHLHPQQKNYHPRVKADGTVGETGFLDKLELKKGSKVMLLYNVDTADGLTNGAQGTICDFTK